MEVRKPNTTGSKLTIEGLSKYYGKTAALEPTNLAVYDGEFLTLLGPSGSGKTTLLMMVCGLVQPSSGTITIDGRDETRTPVHNRDIGLVFQHYALFPHMSVADNVGFPLKMRGLSSSEIRRRIKDALAMVELEHLAHRLPAELSGGQQQRVALARCFVYQPSIILMDEPLGALDKRLRQHLQIEIKELHRHTGATIIYVTHDQEEALAMSDRICLMNHARIEQLGTPQEIYSSPRSTFAADFIGTSNIFHGVAYNDKQGRPALKADAESFLVPPHEFSDGDTISLVVRPEHMKLNASSCNTIRGQIIDSIYAGTDTKVMVRTKQCGLLTVRIDDDTYLPVLGDTVTVSWEPHHSVVVKP